MRTLCFAALSLALVPAGLSQTPAPTSTPAPQPLPTDPRALIAAAAPFYDFNAPDLKPWHLKATYQLYDDKGASSEPGNFEYWWASPQVSRTTWTRGDSTHSTWDTAAGNRAYRGTGAPLRYFESKLEDAFLSPLPDAADLDAQSNTLERQVISLGPTKLSCVMSAPKMTEPEPKAKVPLGLFPTYCFDLREPVLRVSYSLGSVAIAYNKVAKLQGRYMPEEVTIYQGKQKILTATVDSVNGISPQDPALSAPPDVPETTRKSIDISDITAQGMLLRKTPVTYPDDAKSNRISGTVVLHSTIGADGSVHDLHVVSTPWPSLATACLWAVSHWEYKPFLQNGYPIDVETTARCVFSLSH